MPIVLAYKNSGYYYFRFMDYAICFVELLFTVYVVPIADPPLVDFSAVTTVLSSLLLIFGWKYTFFADEIAHLFMLALVIRLRVRTRPHQNVNKQD
jgi:hypothetical protein